LREGIVVRSETQNVESIAYRFGKDQLPLQNFIGTSNWGDERLHMELAKKIVEQLRKEKNGVISFDLSELADYEVRNWKKWRHHQTFGLINGWFW